MSGEARIKAAADELGAALSAVGGHYDVGVDRLDVTTIEDAAPRYVYVVNVVETARKQIAP